MIGVALGWKWRCFAGILTFGFLGIARPGEPLAAFRKDLILPRDMLSEDGGIAYLRILKPKTRFRGGGRTQHVSVHDHEFVLLLDSVFGDLPPEDRLLECSPGAFRRRWAAGMQSWCWCWAKRKPEPWARHETGKTSSCLAFNWSLFLVFPWVPASLEPPFGFSVCPAEATMPAAVVSPLQTYMIYIYTYHTDSACGMDEHKWGVRPAAWPVLKLHLVFG